MKRPRGSSLRVRDSERGRDTVVIAREVGLPVGRTRFSGVGVVAEFLVEFGPSEDVDFARQEREHAMDEVEGVVAIGAEQQHGGAREALVLERGDLDLRGEIDVGVGSVGKAFLESVFLEDSLVRLLVEEALLRSNCVGVGEIEVARLQGET